MKIHIIGNSGTGKTYLADILADKYQIVHYDLDDIYWDNSSNQYGIKRKEDERSYLLHKILKREDWIIEGVYYSWLKESFVQADLIIVLNIPTYICKRRIIHRFIMRKLQMTHGKKETIKSLIDLLKWTDQFKKINIPKIYNILSKYQDKTIYLNNVNEISDYLLNCEC